MGSGTVDAVDATPRDDDEDEDDGMMEALIAMRDVAKAKFDEMPKHVRVFAMWFIFRMIGAVIRSFFSKPPAPVEKKRVVECETAEAFAEALAEAKAAKRPVVVDFTATWCGPCQRVAPIYADMSETYDAMFLKVDVDKNSAVSGAHQVTAMPTFAFYSADGEPHDEKIRGANVQKIVETLEKLGAKKVAKEAKKDA